MGESIHEDNEHIEVDLNTLKTPNKQTHEWRQFGPEIRCMSCPIQHGSFIGNDHVLTGVDENGKPQFAKRLK